MVCHRTELFWAPRIYGRPDRLDICSRADCGHDLALFCRDDRRPFLRRSTRAGCDASAWGCDHDLRDHPDAGQTSLALCNQSGDLRESVDLLPYAGDDQYPGDEEYERTRERLPRNPRLGHDWLDCCGIDADLVRLGKECSYVLSDDRRIALFGALQFYSAAHAAYQRGPGDCATGSRLRRAGTFQGSKLSGLHHRFVPDLHTAFVLLSNHQPSR